MADPEGNDCYVREAGQSSTARLSAIVQA